MYVKLRLDCWVLLSFHMRKRTMKKMILRARRIVRREEGASLAEYGLLVGLIAVVCIAAVTLLGQNIAAAFQAIAAAI